MSESYLTTPLEPSKVRSSVSSSSAPLALDLRNLVVGYGSKIILNGVTLAVPQQSIYALLGPNGSGKTTLLKTLMDLQFARSGTALAFGWDTHKEGVEVRSQTALVSDSVSLFGALNALEHFKFGSKVQPKWDNKFAFSLSEDFELPLKTAHSRLSTGKRAILAIIFALASRPKLLLLDEPTNGLDPAARATFFGQLIDFVSDGGTVFISSHVLGEVESIADHIAILQHGRILFSGNLDRLRGMHSVVQMVLRFEPDPVDLLKYAQIPGVTKVQNQGRTVHLRVEGDPQMLLLLLEPRYQPKDLQVLPRSLESIYLEICEET